MRRRLNFLVRRSWDWVPEWLYHFVYGVLSGIPMCCILYYVSHHNTMIASGYITRVQEFLGNYTPCPSCLSSNRAVPIYLADDDEWRVEEDI